MKIAEINSLIAEYKNFSVKSIEDWAKKRRILLSLPCSYWGTFIRVFLEYELALELEDIWPGEKCDCCELSEKDHPTVRRIWNNFNETIYIDFYDFFRNAFEYSPHGRYVEHYTQAYEQRNKIFQKLFSRDFSYSFESEEELKIIKEEPLAHGLHCYRGLSLWNLDEFKTERDKREEKEELLRQLREAKPKKFPIYYVYLYFRKDGTPFYVGKGCNGRATDTENRSDAFKKVWEQEGRPTPYIGAKDLEEDVALWIERKVILGLRKKYDLVNIVYNP